MIYDETIVNICQICQYNTLALWAFLSPPAVGEEARENDWMAWELAGRASQPSWRALELAGRVLEEAGLASEGAG